MRVVKTKRKCALMHEFVWLLCANQFLHLLDSTMSFQWISKSFLDLLLFFRFVCMRVIITLEWCFLNLMLSKTEASHSIDAQRFNFQAFTEITSITRANKWYEERKKKWNKMRNYCLRRKKNIEEWKPSNIVGTNVVEKKRRDVKKGKWCVDASEPPLLSNHIVQ